MCARSDRELLKKIMIVVVEVRVYGVADSMHGVAGTRSTRTFELTLRWRK